MTDNREPIVIPIEYLRPIPNFLRGRSMLSFRVSQTENEPDDSSESDSSESDSDMIDNETLSEEDRRLLQTMLNEISETAKTVSEKAINGEDFNHDFIRLNGIKASLHYHFTCHANSDGLTYLRRNQQNQNRQATPDPDTASSSSDSD